MYTKDCIYCGKKMYRKSKQEASRENWKYCSYSCVTSHRNKLRVYTKKYVNKLCKFCNIEFKTRDTKHGLAKIFCSKNCLNENSKLFKHSEKTIKKMSGENGNNWKGELVKYEGLHQRIRAILDTTKCTHCGILGERLKYGAWSIECANISGEYKTSIDDWVALCRKCHRKYDISKRSLVEKNCVYCGISVLGIGNRKRACNPCKKENSRISSRDGQRKRRNSIKYNNSKHQDNSGKLKIICK